jgi:hypothetical protein
MYGPVFKKRSKITEQNRFTVIRDRRPSTTGTSIKVSSITNIPITNRPDRAYSNNGRMTDDRKAALALPKLKCLENMDD